jgi:hypothetical protein
VSVLKARPSKLIREACEAGETAATQYILSHIEKKLIRSLNIQVSSEPKEGTTFDVEVSLEVEPAVEVDLDKLSDEAADAALCSIEQKIGAKAKTGAKAHVRKENLG